MHCDDGRTNRWTGQLRTAVGYYSTSNNSKTTAVVYIQGVYHRWLMTHQPVHYLITTRPHVILSQPRPHIILSQPGHAFQHRARPAKSRTPTHHASHSSQDRPCQPGNYLIAHANQSIMLSQPSHTFHFTADYLWKPWLMTHQPVKYLITTRPHIILSQPGHIFQIRARPAQSRPVTHHVSHSSQHSPCQPVNYLSVLLVILTQMIDDPSTCQLPYHNQATHYLIAARAYIPA